jgi:hypothetical protein
MLYRLLDDNEGRSLLVRVMRLLRRWYQARADVRRIEHELGEVGSELRKRSDEVRRQ